MFRRHPAPKRSRNPFIPDYIADSVASIDFAFLQRQGVTACLIDLDDTVVAKGGFEVSRLTIEALKRAPMKLYIATNRPKSRDLKNLRVDLNARGVVHPRGIFAKPLRRYYLTAVKELGLNKKEAVMIGDRFIHDIFAADRAGLRTVLITHKIGPMRNWLESVIYFFKRRAIRRLLGSYQLLRPD